MASQCGPDSTKFLQWHSSVGPFQLSFSSGVPVYPASIRWVAQWYPSVHWVIQWHSSGISVYTGPASVHWLRVRGVSWNLKTMWNYDEAWVKKISKFLVINAWIYSIPSETSVFFFDSIQSASWDGVTESPFDNIVRYKGVCWNHVSRYFNQLYSWQTLSNHSCVDTYYIWSWYLFYIKRCVAYFNVVHNLTNGDLEISTLVLHMQRYKPESVACLLLYLSCEVYTTFSL